MTARADRADHTASARRGRRPGATNTDRLLDCNFVFRKNEKRATFLVVAPRDIPPAGGAGRGLSDGFRRKKFGGKRNFPFSARKPLIFHETDEGIFGNTCRKRPQIWKCLARVGKSLRGSTSGEAGKASRRARFGLPRPQNRKTRFPSPLAGVRRTFRSLRGVMRSMTDEGGRAKRDGSDQRRRKPSRLRATSLIRPSLTRGPPSPARGEGAPARSILSTRAVIPRRRR